MANELDFAKYTKLFVTESREYLRILNESMVQLESDPTNEELVAQMFRACHTIKGMAGMMSMVPVTETAHALEDLLGAIRDKTLEPTGNVAEAIFSGIDALESLVVAVEKGQPLAETPGVIDGLKNSLKGVKEPRKPAKKKGHAEEKPVQVNTMIKIKLARRCSMPSARAAVILKELEKTSHVLGNDPTEEEIEKERVFEELTVELDPGDKLEDSLRRISAMNDVDEVLIGDSILPREKWRRIGKADSSQGSSEAPVVQTVKVGMDKLDNLLDDVGELVIGRSRLLERASGGDDADLREISSLIDKLTSEIQSKVLGIRMIPLDLVISRFPRMIRDMSKSQGKDIELIVEGSNIELDRTVMDRIADPMMHILRNCVDHGIETVEDREKAGKKPKGIIRIVASKQQDHVLIEVSDDGRGIDYDKIKKAAVSRGIMTKEQANQALARDLVELLFRPGFSTKTEVTEVSGRGVGLDIVKKSVEELGGSVMINTSLGAGTTISLWLPFTLAIIDAMLVMIAGQMYAVPLSVVVESHNYIPSDIKKIRNREVVQLRGEVLPLIRMRDFFGIAEAKRGLSINVLIVQSRDRRAAIEVDELLGHQQIVVKGLDKRLRKIKGISGGTILGSGKIALILDADTILGG